MKYFNLNYIVKSVMAAKNVNTTHDYQRWLQFAFRGYRVLNLYLGMPTQKTVYLPVSDALQVRLPDDYVDYRAIGVCINGRIITLTLANDICLAHNLNECCEPEPVPNPATNNINALPLGWLFLPTWRNGQWVGEQYGTAGGLNRYGYYKIDREHNIIQFASVIPKTEIALEYKSSGTNCDGDSIVPSEAIEPLISWIDWQDKLNDRTVSRGDKQDAKLLYEQNYNAMEDYVNRFTKDEFLDNWYSTITDIKR